MLIPDEPEATPDPDKCDHRAAEYRFAQMNVVGLTLTIADWLECPCGMVSSMSAPRADWRPGPYLGRNGHDA